MRQDEHPTTRRSDEAAPGQARRKLVLRSALPGVETALVLEGKQWSLGRGTTCDYRIEAAGVSRVHAQIERRGPVCAIRDLDSTNGTFVDGCRTSLAGLVDGTVVRLGEWLGVVEEHPEDEPGPYGVSEHSPGLWGGARIAAVLRRLLQASNSTLPVVLIGRTGAGKERFARALHQGDGASRPFHAVNCATLPAALADAELFGYRKGAFTGAERAHDGHLRAAHGGTLFLDELAELPLAIQAKLLRALDSGELAPIGDTVEKHFKARVIAACQVPLAELVESGRLREDLAARLAGLTIALPELRERRGDVPGLFSLFLALYSGGTAPDVSVGFHERLCLLPWPGNVRELELFARQMLALHGLEPTLRRSHLPELPGGSEPTDSAASGSAEREENAEAFKRALKTAGGNVTQAAVIAGISRQRAYRLIWSRRLSHVLAASREGGGNDEPDA